jgi:hypothetical protein
MKPQLRWDWARVAILVWVGLASGFAIYGYLFPWSHSVFYIYARASRYWWLGQDMYQAKDTDYYRYSPLFAISISPLAFLSEAWGNALWRISSCLIYAAGLWAWIHRGLPLHWSRERVAALFLLVLPISLHSMYNGQANVLMLGFLLLGLAAAAADQWNWAAGWLALATLIKGYPLALALLVAALHPRRFALRFTAALSLGLLLPFATQPPGVVVDQYASWSAHLRDSTTIMRERVRSLEHLFALYGQPLSPSVFMPVQLLAGLGVLGLCWLHARRTSDPRQQLTMTFLLFATWVVLFGPATETCTYVIIAPAIAWTLVEEFSRRSAWGVCCFLIASLLLMGPLITDFAGPVVRHFANEHGSQPVGASLFLAYLLTRLTDQDFIAVHLP